MRASNIALSIVCGPFICAYLIFSSCFCPSDPARPPRNEDKQRFERRQNIAPRPLPVRTLDRCLTLPLQSPRSCRGRTIVQDRSHLMQLPLELRRMIYRAALGDCRLHLVLKENKLGHLRCKGGRAYGCMGAWNWGGPSRNSCWGNMDSANIWHPLSGRKEPTDGDILPFLQSCRQVYSESIDFLYSTNLFAIKDLDCLRYLALSTLPYRFTLISRLEITWPLHWPIYDSVVQNRLLADPALYPPHDEATWEETWRIVAQMSNLNYLRVELHHYHGFRDPEFETRMLKPMRQITHVKNFEVHVSWSGAEINDAPFKFNRPRDGIATVIRLSNDEFYTPD